jgi:acetyl esterase/lipase
MSFSKLFVLLFVFVHCTSVLWAQKSFPRDTSFTVKGTFEKEKKKFPHIEIALADTNNLKIKKDIVYKIIAQRKLTVDVFQPLAEGKNIGILLIHGGGWKTGDKTHMHELAKALAKKGYTCFAVEYRLSLEAKYPAAVEDLQDAIRWMKKNAAQYAIHPNTIICLGTSSGGQLASLIGVLNKSLATKANKSTLSPSVKAVINIDGLLSFSHPDAQEGTMAAEWLGGDSIGAAQNWKQASALTHLSKNSAPMLFITSGFKRFSAGKNDLMQYYKKWGISYDELHFEHSPHTFWYFHPWFIPTVNKIDEFISGLI